MAGRRLATVFAACAALSALPASGEPLAGEALKALVAGKAVFLSTPYGLEFPLRYNTNGTVSGDASGFFVARMLAPKETGRWWIDGDQLCQQWKSWYDGKTLCFTVNQTGASTISWKRNDGLAGTARIEG